MIFHVQRANIVTDAETRGRDKFAEPIGRDTLCFFPILLNAHFSIPVGKLGDFPPLSANETFRCLLQGEVVGSFRGFNYKKTRAIRQAGGYRR